MTRKEILQKQLDMWSERLVYAEIDYNTYNKLPPDTVIVEEEKEDFLPLNKQIYPVLRKKSVTAGDIVNEAQKRKEVAQRFIETIREMLEKEKN